MKLLRGSALDWHNNLMINRAVGVTPGGPHHTRPA
jgi:hypothetical protein